MRVNYRKGERWCSRCGQRVKPIGLNCPECGYKVRQAPRKSIYRKLFQGIAGLYSTQKIGLKTATASS